MPTQHFDIIIIGNGALAIASAFSLWQEKPDCKIALVGPQSRLGSASVAAGAMLNSFAELEDGTLADPMFAHRFSLNRKASALWENWIEKINQVSPKNKITLQYGTYVIQNARADSMDEANFKAIIQALTQHQEPYEWMDVDHISGLSPEPAARALNAIYLPREGFFNPRQLFLAYDDWLSQSTHQVKSINDTAEKLTIGINQHKIITTAQGLSLSAPQLLIAAGAESQKLIEQLPIRANSIPRLFYGIGTGLLFKSPAHGIEKVIRTTNRGMACGVHLVPQDENVVYVGATNRISPWPEYTPRLTNLYVLLQAAMEQLNTDFYKAEFIRYVVGHRPTTLDTFPLFGETSIPNIFIASGTKRDGLFMSPLWGDAMAKLMLKQPISFENKFQPERSLIHTMTRSEGIKKAVAHLSSAAYQHELRLPKSGWNSLLIDALTQKVEKVYDKCGIQNFGFPVEMLDMYQHGHADAHIK